MKALCISTCHLIANGHGSIFDPVREISGKKFYCKGDFSIAKSCERAYVVLWKNVIVGEFVGANKELVDLLHSKTAPDSKKVMQSYNYRTALADIEEAQKWAERYSFKIC